MTLVKRPMVSVRLVLARWLFTLAVALISVSACIGDPSHEATIENATSQTITVYLLGREYPSVVVDLPPGEKHKTNYLASSQRSFIAKIEATTKTGELLYCRRFDYEAMERISWYVRITVGTVSC